MLFFALGYLFITIAASTECSTQDIHCTKNPFNPCQLSGTTCRELNITWSCFKEQVDSVCSGDYNEAMDPKSPFIDQIEAASQNEFKSDMDVFDECFFKWYYGITRGESIQDFCKFYETTSSDCMSKTATSPCGYIVHLMNMSVSILAKCECDNKTTTVGAEAGKLIYFISIIVFTFICSIYYLF